MKLLRIIAVISLFADAYIGLVLIAMDRMQAAYLRFLPPFGRKDLQAIPRSLWMLLIAWTATLAIACLCNRPAALRNRNEP